MVDQRRLRGESAIVTGGAAGLGEAISKTLAREGASVAVVDINLPGAEKVAKEIEQNG